MRNHADTDAICGPYRSTAGHSPAGAEVRSDNDNDFHRAADEGYPRRISIPLPRTAANIYGISNIEVPVRLILTTLAADCPRTATTIAAIRDDFFGGDHEDDIHWTCVEGFDPDIGWEQRAEMAVERRIGAAKRDAARAALQAEAASTVEHQATFRVAPDAAHLTADVENEIWAIAVECEIVEMLQKALALDWQAFVLERHHYTDEQADRRRAQLLEKAEDLRSREEAASARLREMSVGFYDC